MWTYSTDAIASHAFGAPSIEEVTGVTLNGKSYDDKYLFNGDRLIISEGRQAMAGIRVDGRMIEAQTVVVEGDTIIADGAPLYAGGVAKISPDGGAIAAPSGTIVVDGVAVPVVNGAETVGALSTVSTGDRLMLAHIAKDLEGNGKYVTEQTSELPVIAEGDELTLNYRTVLNAASKEYQDAGDWNGVLLAIQAIAAVIWAVVLSQFRRRKLGYSLSLLIGAAGFVSVYFIHSPAVLGVSYALMGCAWAAILAMPFTILTNALSGNHIGTYLGLFNCTICIPQIIAALCGGAILSCFPLSANGAPQTVWMLVVSGVLLAIGALFVWNIRETFGVRQK